MLAACAGWALVGTIRALQLLAPLALLLLLISATGVGILFAWMFLRPFIG